MAIGLLSHSGFERGRQEQLRERRPVSAQLLKDPHVTPDSSGVSRVARATVRWWDAGAAHTDTVEVPPVMRAGDRTTVYLDGSSGRRVRPPANSSDVALSTMVAAVAAAGGFTLVWGAARAGSRRVMNHRRYAEWDRECAAVEPVWTGHRRS